MNIFRMMRLAGALALAACTLLPAQQDDEAAPEETPKTTSKEKKLPKGLKPVPLAIAEMDTFNAKPDLKAKYYIYLISASWCGPCRALMPKVVEAYPAMKKKKVEVLLISADQSLKEAQEYPKSHNAKFPAIWQNELKKVSLPGMGGGAGIPWAVFVTADGEQLENAAANQCILNWEEICYGKKKGPKKGGKKK